jgi:hypothetical protein
MKATMLWHGLHPITKSCWPVRKASASTASIPVATCRKAGSSSTSSVSQRKRNRQSTRAGSETRRLRTTRACHCRLPAASLESRTGPLLASFDPYFALVRVVVRHRSVRTDLGRCRAREVRSLLAGHAAAVWQLGRSSEFDAVACLTCRSRALPAWSLPDRQAGPPFLQPRRNVVQTRCCGMSRHSSRHQRNLDYFERTGIGNH